MSSAFFLCSSSFWFSSLILSSCVWRMEVNLSFCFWNLISSGFFVSVLLEDSIKLLKVLKPFRSGVHFFFYYKLHF